MAKLPTREELGAPPSARSGRPIASYDTSAIGRGVAQLGKGISGIGDAISDVQKHNEAIEGFETERKFQEFKWNKQLELDQATREMEPGQAGGFADRWTQGYKQSASEFFKGVPEKLKGKYEAELFRAEREQYGVAAGFGRTEQKRSALAGIEDFKNNTLAKSGNLDKARGAYEGLVNANPYLTPIEKEEARRKGVSDLEDQHVQSLLGDKKNARAVLRDLGFGPETTTPARAPGVEPGIDAVSTDADVAPVARRRASVPISVRLETGQTDPLKGVSSIAKDTNGSHSYGNFGLNSQGSAQAFVREYGAALGLSGEPGTAAFDNSWREAARADPQALHRAEMDWREKTIVPRVTSSLTKAGVDAGVAGDPRVQAYFADRLVQYGPASITNHAARVKTAFDRSSGDPVKFLREMSEYDRDNLQQDFPSALRTGNYSAKGHDTRVYGRLNLALAGAEGGADDETTTRYAGPYRNLSADQRFKLAATARTILKQEVAEIGQEVTAFEKIAEQGFAPKPAQFDALRARVEESGDPETTRNFAQAVDVMRWQDVARKWTPAELDANIAGETRRLREGGATAFDAKRLTMASKLLDTMRTELKQDALGWAERVGHIQVQPIDFAAPDGGASSVAARVKQADAVADHYGLEPKYLRPDERQRLAMGLDEGGDRALAVARAISSAAGDKARDIFAEVSKESPTAAIIGGIVAETGLSAAARDAVEGIKLRKEPGFQSAGGPRQIVRKALTDELGSALSGMPTVENAMMDTANAIYEIRARKQNIADFDANIWRQGLRESVGERDVNGEKYGGIDDANPGWGTRNIIIPPFIKQDGWRQTIEAISLPDLENAGLGLPADGAGKPIALARVKGAVLVQTGSGRYALSLGDPDTPGEEKWVKRQSAPGEIYEIDMYRLRPFLQNRRPELFAGGDELTFQSRRPYDANQQAVPVPPTIDNPLAVSGLGG